MVSSSIRLSRLSELQRVIVLLLAVTGILVGLLAMHTLTAITGDHTTHHDAVAAAPHDHGDAHGAVAADGVTMADNATGAGGMLGAAAADCNGACESGHNMAGMACLLALLITSLILTVRVIITRWGSDLCRLVAALAAALPAALAPPAPPSLLTLSISRT